MVTRKRERRAPAQTSRNVYAIVAIVLAALIAFTGGSSRPDAIQLLVLRPSVVIIGVVLLMIPATDWRRYRALLILLGLFAATMVIQLVPLPPALWHALPGHGRFNDVLDAVGASTAWRPITVSVDGTLNALASTLVPLVVLIAMMQLRTDLRSRALLLILLVGAISMVLGVIQMAGSSTSPLYFYETDANDQLVGLFANRNHQAAMLAALLPLLRAWALTPGGKQFKGNIRGAVAAAAAVVVVAFLLVLGSRAGLVLIGVGLLGAWLIKPRIAEMRKWSWRQWLMAAGGATVLATVFAIVVLADRSATTERIATMQGLSGEGRIEVLPVLWRIASDVWPFGTGYGSFVPVFASYEPDSMLTPYYWNNAHNEPLEVLITGGLPGILVMAAFMFWWARAALRVLTTGDRQGLRIMAARAAVFATLIFMLGSLVDYPVRTPLITAIFTLLCCFMAEGESRLSAAVGRS